MAEGGTITIEVLMSQFEKTKQNLVSLGTETQKLAATVDKNTASFQKNDTVLTATGSKTKTLQTNTNSLNTTLTQTKPKTDQVSTSMGTMGTNATKAGQSTQQLNDKQKLLNTTSQATQQAQRNVGLSLAATGTAMISVATQVTQLGNQYDSLKDKQFLVEGSAQRLQKAKTALRGQVEALRLAEDKGTKTEEQLAVQRQKLVEQTDKVNLMEEKHADMVADVNREWKQFGLQIAGTVMTSLTGIMTAVSALNSTKGLKAVSTGVDAVGKSSRGLLATLGPILLIAGALTAAFLAIKNNTLGFRDMLNDLGVKIGTFVPALKPFLEFLKQLGGFLGIAGEESEGLKTQFLASITAIKDQGLALFNQISAGIGTFVTGVLDNFDLLAQGDIGAVFNNIVAGIQSAIASIASNETLKNLIDQFSSFVSNPQNWTDMFLRMVEAIQSVMVFTQEHIIPIVTGLIEQLIAWVSDPQNWQNVWTALVDGFLGVVEWVEDNILAFIQPFIDLLIDWVSDPNNWQEIWEAILEGWEGMVDWTEENILPMVEGFLDMIVKWAEDPENWSDLWDSMVKGWQGIMKWTEENILPIIDSFAIALGVWSDKTENWSELGGKIATGIGKAVIFTKIHIAPLITSFFDTLKADLIATPEQNDLMAQQIVTGISGAIQGLLGALGKLIIDTIFGTTGTGSAESKAVIATGAEGIMATTLDELIAQAEAEDATAKYDEMVASILSFMGASFKTNVDGYTSIAKWIWEGIKLHVGEAVAARGKEIMAVSNQILTFIADGIIQFAASILIPTGQAIYNSIYSAIANIAQKLLEIGKQILIYILDGIGVDPKPVMDAMGKMADSILKYPWGEIGKGIWKLIADGIGSAAESLGNLLPEGSPLGEVLKNNPFGTVPTAFQGGGGRQQEVNETGAPVNRQQQQQQGEGGQGLGIASAIIQEIVVAMQALTEFQAFFETTFLVGLTTLITQFHATVFTVWLVGMKDMLILFQTEALIAFQTFFETFLVSLTTLITQFHTTVFSVWLVGMKDTLILFNDEALVLFSTNFEAMLVALTELITNFMQSVFIVWLTGMKDLLTVFQNEVLVEFQTVFGEVLLNLGDAITQWMDDIFIVWLVGMKDLLNEFLTKVFVVWKDGIIKTLNELNQAWVDHEQAILDALTLAGQHLFDFAVAVVELRDGVIEAAEQMSQAFSDFGDMIAEVIPEAISQLEDLISTIEDIESAADSATKALNKMAEAARKAAAARSAVGGGGSRFGGILQTGTHHAMGTIIKTQRSINGHQVGEFNKWEAVIPLSDPFNAQDKNSLAQLMLGNQGNMPVAANANLGAMNLVNSLASNGGGGGARVSSGGGRPIIVTGNLMATFNVDGKKISAVVNEFQMVGQDGDMP